MAHKTYIEAKASELGYSQAAILKWRQRRVPYQARIEIIKVAAHDGVLLTLNDFNEVTHEAGNI